MKFFVESIGCARRDFEAQKVYNYLIHHGYQPVQSGADADLVIIGTCAFIDNKEQQSLKFIHKYRAIPNAKVVVIGCLSKISPQVTEDFPDVSFLSPSTLSNIQHVLDLPTDFESFQNPSKVNKEEILESTSSLRGNEIDKYEHTYCVQISVGCMGNCTYCGIRRAIGRVNSRPKEVILEDLHKGLEEGYTHFYLTSDDVGCYGLDIDTNIGSLLEDVFAVDSNFKLMLKDFSPRWLIKFDLGNLLKDNVVKISELDFPIQSGSNRILGLMNRHYTIEEVQEHLRDLCDLMPVTSQFIVGFPTETYQDFQQTCNAVRSLGLADMLIYPYGEREGVDSRDLHPKVHPDKIEERLKELRELKKLMRCRRLI